MLIAKASLVLLCLSAQLLLSMSDTAVHDEKGYLLFCLCMGRFGNQAEHFLGSLAFAKKIDRTLVVPPFRTYKNIPFTEWFRLDALSSYHSVILAEEFMETVAPTLWPPGNRTGLCYSFKESDKCEMKKGNPFGPFWDGLGVEFDATETYRVTYQDPESWAVRFPKDKYPVVALKGAPAPFPILAENRPLQQYLQWSDFIVEQGQKYITDSFPGQKFLGIHLRNGKDWENACSHIDPSFKSYMASPQCISPGSGQPLNKDICLPSTELVLQQTRKLIETSGVQVIYVATDRYPLTTELTSHLQDYKVKVFHQDPYLPQLDLYILGQADFFIGNCVSSFTAFVTRERTVTKKHFQFWGL